MPMIKRDGYRYSSQSMATVMKEARRNNVTEAQLFNAAKQVDGGDKMLSAADLRKGLKQLITKPSKLEELMHADVGEFSRKGRADIEAPAAQAIPRRSKMTFTPTQSADSEAQELRDQRMDLVAQKLTEKINALPRWRAELVGGDRGSSDLTAGALPMMNQSPNSRAYGEAYALVKTRIPRVGEQLFALTWSRQLNLGNPGGLAGEYADDEARLSLQFVDARTGKLTGGSWDLIGTGSDFNTWNQEDEVSPSDFFRPGASARAVEDMADRLAEAAVNELIAYKEIND